MPQAETLTPVAPVPGYGPASERVARQIRQWIAEEVLPPAGYVPGERALAEQLDCSRGTVRTALEQLEREKVVYWEGARRRATVFPRPNTVLNDTVAILTLRPEELIMPQDSEGWERFVEVGAAEALGNKGLHVLGLYLDRLTDATLDRLVEHPPVGLLAGGHAQERPAGCRVLERMSGTSAKIVVYGNGVERRKYDRVYSDHEEGTRALTDWLITKRGRKRILRLWARRPEGSYPYWLENRDRGYENAMRQAGLDVLPATSITSSAEPDSPGEFELRTRLVAGYLVEHLHTDHPVDAIMAISDGSVQAVMAACQLLGCKPNVDVDVVGYDNYWDQSITYKFGRTAPLATVDKRNREMGHEMVRLLRDRLDGRLPPEPQSRIVAPELVFPSEALQNQEV